MLRQLAGSEGLHSVTQGRSVIFRLCVVIAVVIAMLAIFDVILRSLVGQTDLVRREVEIQGPATLFAKISDFERTPAPRRVALLGDSLILGKTMEEAGIADWRSRNLSGQLDPVLNENVSEPYEILNLGMNGALPTDMEIVLDSLLQVGVGAVIFDVNLRHFSSDFTTPEASMSRDWLRNFSVNSEGKLSGVSDKSFLDSAVEVAALNYWYSFRVRHQLRDLALGGTPDEAVRRVRDWFNGLFAADQGFFDDEMRLLLNARSRYETITLAQDNPQVAALERMVRKLAEARVPTVIFYATERPDIIGEITDPQIQSERIAKLAGIIRTSGGELTEYVPPLQSLQNEDFIDHVHVLPTGYSKYVEVVGARLRQLLSRKNEN